jgi:hypothetical protein
MQSQLRQRQPRQLHASRQYCNASAGQVLLKTQPCGLPGTGVGVAQVQAAVSLPSNASEYTVTVQQV